MDMENKGVYTLSKAEKDRLTALFSDALNADERVIFAYLCGSFVDSNFFRDINIFVFILEDEDPFACQAGVGEKLFEARHFFVIKTLL